MDFHDWHFRIRRSPLIPLGNYSISHLMRNWKELINTVCVNELKTILKCIKKSILYIQLKTQLTIEIKRINPQTQIWPSDWSCPMRLEHLFSLKVLHLNISMNGSWESWGKYEIPHHFMSYPAWLSGLKTLIYDRILAKLRYSSSYEFIIALS